MASDKKSKRLQELRGSDFEITDGQPDIVGWEIINPEGSKVGKVSDLIFDSRARRVRYMIVNLADNKELQLESRKVLVPIGLAQLDATDDLVVLHNVTPYQLRALPKYSSDDLGAKAERAISTVFGRSHTQGSTAAMDADIDNSFYEDDLYNDSDLYTRRPRNTARTPITGTDDNTRTVNDDYREKTTRRSEPVLRDEEDVDSLEADLNRADRTEETDAYRMRGEREAAPVADRNRDGEIGRADTDPRYDLDAARRRQEEENAQRLRDQEAAQRTASRTDTDDCADRPETNEEYIRRARKDIDNR